MLKKKDAEGTSIPTHFIDSTSLIAPFMNAKKTSMGFELAKGLNFMGRSGVKLMKGGLRVAYLSGIDFDIISEGGSTEPIKATVAADPAYIGNYFTN